MKNERKLIGIFYDGGYFSRVNQYYNSIHEEHSGINFQGLHAFIKQYIADREGVDVKRCQISEAHYFRGRVNAQVAEERALLVSERKFDDRLMQHGITTHYLPLTHQKEKGVDVAFALEAYELARAEKFDVMVMFAGDSDFVPLVRKVTALGIRVMLLAWDFQYTDHHGQTQETHTAQSLWQVATYPVQMDRMIGDRAYRGDSLIRDLLMPKRTAKLPQVHVRSAATPATSAVFWGTVMSVKEGYGFITPEAGGDNLFFHHSGVVNVHFGQIKENDAIEYEIGANDKGPCAVNVRWRPHANAPETPIRTPWYASMQGGNPSLRAGQSHTGANLNRSHVRA